MSASPPKATELLHYGNGRWVVSQFENLGLFSSWLAVLSLYPCVLLLPLMNVPASRAAHAERDVQVIELDHVRGQAGRNGRIEHRATDHDVGHWRTPTRERERPRRLDPQRLNVI